MSVSGRLHRDSCGQTTFTKPNIQSLIEWTRLPAGHHVRRRTMARSAAPRQWLAAVFDVTGQVAAKQAFRSASDWCLAKGRGTLRSFALKGAMNSPTPDAHVFRFGVFELDVRSGELRRHGLKIRLPDQSFQILRALLMRPGELVTRDELRQLLWTAETFVDFEVGLNSAVRKLREALDDSADNPRFVETVPRHGYRFVGAQSSARRRRRLRGNVRSSSRRCRPCRRDDRSRRPSLCPCLRGSARLASASLACGCAPVRPACRDGGSCLPQRAAHGLGTPPRPKYRSGPSWCSRSRT